MISSSSPFRENLLSDENMIYCYSLKSHGGLSDVYMDMGEGKCDLVVSDVEHFGNPVKGESLITGEANGVLDLNEREEMDRIKVVVDKDGILMDEVNLGEVDELLGSYESINDEI